MTLHPKPKVLVFGSDNRSFLSVIRSFGRNNLEVHVVSLSRTSSALQSKYVFQNHLLPSFNFDPKGWKKELLKILKEHSFDLVVPCEDSAILPLRQFKDELNVYSKIYILDDNAYEVTIDKAKTSALAKSLDISVPKEVFVSDASQIESVLIDFEFPLVLKPVSSFQLGNLSRKLNVQKVFDEKEFKLKLKGMLNDSSVIVQENFIGIGVGVELLASEGDVLVALQHERVHEPLMGGGSSYRKSVSLNPELLKAAKKMVRSLNYTGVAMVEFKYNLETKKWILIEINGRFWGSLPLALASGVDFPFYLYQLLINNQKVFPQDYKTGIYCRNFISDLYWFVRNIKADRRDPALCTRPLLKVFSEILHFLTLKEHSDTFVLDDLSPGFYELKDLFNKVSGKIVKKIFKGPVNRKKLEQLTRKKLSEADRVLFVCKGNICRSPFAAEYAKTIWQEKKIESTGYFHIDNRPSPETGIKVAGELGINLDAHRSTKITSEMVQRADIIFVFDQENYRMISQIFPKAESKLYFLGALSSQGSYYIQDPYSGDEKVFMSNYKLICSKVM